MFYFDGFSKLYGKFDDVTVWEFLAVQLDMSKYRLGWDTSTAQCREVDIQDLVPDTAVTTPGDNTGDTTDNGDNTATEICHNKSQAMVYYWEVQYPAFFSNRSL